MSGIPGKHRDGLSICIPNWNHRNFLPRSIGSAMAAARALNDAGLKCEVLVLDDYSRDGSQRMLLSMAMMDRCGVLNAMLMPQNIGLAGVRNHAMAVARYKWVCFLDADNELYAPNIPHFLRSAMETGAAVVYGNLVSRMGERVTSLISNDVINESILASNYIDALSIVDADQIHALGGYRNPYPGALQAHEDWELLLHLIAENQQLVFVPMALGEYHVVENSMVKESNWDLRKIHRIYDQRKVGLPRGFSSRIYHPDLGYIN